MKLLQTVLFITFIAVMAPAHADEKLDGQIALCDQNDGQFYKAEEEWMDEVEEYKECTKSRKNCSKDAKDAAYAERNKLMAQYNADKAVCNAARKKKEAEESGK